MNNCQKCWTGDCADCLFLKELPAQRLIEELISRKLVMVQHDSHTRKIQGYYLWRADIEKHDKPTKQK